MSAGTAAAGRAATPARGRRAMAMISRTGWVDVAVLSALALVAIAGFEPAFGPYDYLLAAVGGLVVGTLVAVLCRLANLSVWPSGVIAFAAYLLFCGLFAMQAQAIAHVIPSAATLAGAVQGAIFGWGDIVTLTTPVEAPPYIAVVPYFASWLVAAVSVNIALRWLPKKRRTIGRAALLLIPAAVLYIAGILIGTDQPYYAGVRGVVFAGIALVWLGWRRQAPGAVAISVDGSARRRKVIGVAIVVLGAVVIGAVGGVLLAPANRSRFVLRQEVTPPFDPLQYPSPLAGFRTYTKKLAKTDLFTVTGLQEGERIRMATLDSYDGVVWQVASPTTQTSDSGGFELLGRDIPKPALLEKSSKSTLGFAITGYNDVWLPDAAYPSTLDFTTYTGTDPTTTVRVNPTTATVALTSGVKKGLDYTISVDNPAVPSDKSLAKVPVASLQLPPVTSVPDVVASKATEYAGTAKTAIQQLRNIERSLKTVGYLSHGLASDPVPSRAGEGADRMTELFTKEPMVGDDEQYASAFALMARSLGYPVRVVMGFDPKVTSGDKRVTVTGKDVAAWDEVAFKGVGWVPFYPTPTKTDAPQDLTVKPKIEPQPQVRQPPPANQKQDQVLTPVKISDKNPPEKKPGFALPGWALVAGGVVLIPLAVYFIPLLIVALLKSRRRARRLVSGPPDRRVAGSWDELVDRYAELGLEVPARSTRLQAASAIERQSREQGIFVPERGFAPLASAVNTVVFSADEPSEGEVATAWAASDEATGESFRSAGWLRRRIASFRIHRRRRAQ